MPLRRGDVVLVQFPYSSGTGSKLRPALLVQSDHNNQRLANVILAPITTTTHRQSEPTQLLIDKATPAGKSAGLRHTSAIICENLTTVALTLVRVLSILLSPYTLRILFEPVRIPPRFV